MTSGIPKGKTKQTDEERKANRNERQQRPENKAKRREYSQRPENKAKAKEYHSRPENKAKQKERQQRPENKVRRKERDQMPENKAKRMARDKSPEGRARRRKLETRPDHIAKRKEDRENSRLKVLQHYSKTLSKSDVSCCRCCGLNKHTDFLSIDHILGAKKMDSIPEVVKLGYSSKMQSMNLTNWIIANNYLKDLQTEYFQILCHNCNLAKGYKKNNNECPLEGKPH